MSIAKRMSFENDSKTELNITRYITLEREQFA